MYGRRLKQLRERAGLTQQQLSVLAGIGHSTYVSELERSETRDVGETTLRSLARALNCTLDELVDAPESSCTSQSQGREP